MSNILWKHIYLCLSKIKCFPTCLPPPPLPSQQEGDHPTTTTTTTLIKSFDNPLSNPTTTTSDLSTSSTFFSSSSDSSSDDTDHLSPPDFAALFASHRFFFPSPGHSNSIAHSPYLGPDSNANPDPNPNPLVAGRVSISAEATDPDPLVAGGVAVDTDSPDPYWDFRRSMQEMVDARQLFDVKADWDYLHELLLCYLSLNPKHTHEFIFGAFSDLLVSLMSSNSPAVIAGNLNATVKRRS